MDNAAYYFRLEAFNNKCEELAVKFLDKSHLDREHISVRTAWNNLYLEFHDLQSMGTWPPI